MQSSPNTKSTNDLVSQVKIAQADLFQIINAFKNDVTDAITARDIFYEKLNKQAESGPARQ